MCLEYIAQAPSEILSRAKKIEFFAETRHAYGRTALLLSGKDKTDYSSLMG